MSADEKKKPFCHDKLTYTLEEGRLRMANTLDEMSEDDANIAIIDILSYYLTVGFERERHDSMLWEIVRIVREANDDFYEWFDAQEEEEARQAKIAAEARKEHEKLVADAKTVGNA
jgi:hypothetical protein